MRKVREFLGAAIGIICAVCVLRAAAPIALPIAILVVVLLLH